MKDSIQSVFINAEKSQNYIFLDHSTEQVKTVQTG